MPFFYQTFFLLDVTLPFKMHPSLLYLCPICTLCSAYSSSWHAFTEFEPVNQAHREMHYCIPWRSFDWFGRQV